MLELEQPGGDALAMFKQAHGPALLVPKEFGGMGASLSEAVHIQRAIGSRSPSLAVATTMHHFSVASLVELTATGGGFEWAMLEAIATNNWLMSSGFAEGKTGQHILAPTMQAKRVDGGLVVQGRQEAVQPHLVHGPDERQRRRRGPRRRPRQDGGHPHPRQAARASSARSSGRAGCWPAPRATRSCCATCTFPTPSSSTRPRGTGMDPIQSRGFTWFELLIAASYVGVASGLAERVIAGGRGSAEDRVGLATELEAATAALQFAASGLAACGDLDAELAQALYARYAAERAIERVAMAAPPWPAAWPSSRPRTSPTCCRQPGPGLPSAVAVRRQ